MLFYIIFISQIFLLSWYLPKLMRERMQKVLLQYPEKDYPKLYVKSTEENQAMIKRYAVFNHVLIVVGLLVLLAMIAWEYSTKGQLSPMVPWAYFMLQMVPVVMLEVGACKSFKMMRKTNTKSTKTATIKPRRLFDFISPELCMVFFVLLLIAFGLVFYQYGFNEKALVNIVIILISNVFFAGMIYWNIYGKKMDPYQSEEDRLRTIKITVNSIIYISIAVNIFLASQMLIKIFDFTSLKTIVMSLYCQMIVLMSSYHRLNSIKLEDIDFEVYKDDVINDEQAAELK